MVLNAALNISIISQPVDISCFPGVLITSAPHNTLYKPLAAFPHNHRRKIDSSERVIKPVTFTFINARKEYWPCRTFERATPCSLYYLFTITASLHYH